MNIIGTIVIEGVKYLLGKAVDDLGNQIWQAFVDSDNDGVADTPDTPYTTWDEEPVGWTPSGILVVDPPESTTDNVNLMGSVVDGAGSFLTDIFTPVMNTAATSPVCLAFLSVTFISLAVTIVKKLLRSFGRGR